MDISLADVIIHIDETLSLDRRAEIEDQLRQVDGVVSVHNPDDRPHLTIIEYRPDKVSAQSLLGQVQEKGVHAKLVGL